VICDDGSSSTISIALTGTPPWFLEVRSTGGKVYYFDDIQEPLFKFQSAEAGTYYVNAIRDANCSYRRPKESVTG
jgi:hypothetical protein